MKLVENVTDEGITKLTIAIEPDEVREWIESWLEEHGPGKKLRQFDSADWADERVQEEAKTAIFKYAERTILDEKYPSPIDAPLFAMAQNISPDKPLAFGIDYTTLPERELKTYDPVSMRLPIIKTSDGEVMRELEAILKSVPCAQEKPEGAVVEDGDTVEISMDARAGDAPYDALSSTLRQYRLGDNFMPPAFDEALLGKKVGDEAVCSLKIEHRGDLENPSEDTKEYLDVDVHLKLLKIMREDIMAIDDSFVQRQFPGIGTVDQLKQGIRQELDDQKADMLKQEKMRRITAELSSRVEGGIPDAVYEAHYAVAVKNFTRDLEEQGKTFEGFLEEQGIDEHQFRVSTMMNIRSQLKAAIALDAYARHFGLEADEDDVNGYLNEMLQTEGEDAVRMVQEAPYHAGVIESARRWKSQQHALGTAIISYFD